MTNFTPIIDQKFRLLKYHFVPTDTSSLEADICKNGCLSPILIWNGIIIDGHKRFDICTRFHIPYKLESINFDSRENAICYICTDELKNYDLTSVARNYLIGKLFEARKVISKRYAQQERKDSVPKLGRPVNFSFQNAIDIGNEYNISHNTVYKYGIYTKALDNIILKEPDLAHKIFSETLKISHYNIIELSRLSSGELKNLNQQITDDKIDRINYSYIRHELQWKRSKAAMTPGIAKKEDTQDYGIKKKPVYDPDAEISSLALTMPSWSGSIIRVTESTDFKRISKDAKNKLLVELHNLYQAVTPLIDKIGKD